MNSPTDVPAAFADAVAGGSSYAVLAAVCLAALILPLTFVGVAVATPAIGRELGGGPLALSWITNAFMLSFGSVLMAAGTLADEYGRKRVFSLGVGLFALTSLALAFAPSVLWLDLLRALQGLAGAAALAGGSAALAQEFEGPARTRAFSLLGTTFGVGLAFGPILAGLLIEAYGWRSIFVSGTLIGGLSLLFGVPRMHESRDPDAAGVDWPGTLSFTAALVALTWGILQAPQSGWGSPWVWGLLLVALLALLLFIVVELRVRRPMLDLSLFRYPRFVGVQLLPIATCYCFVVLLILLPIRFIGVEGYSEIDAGLMMIALSAPMVVVPLLAAWLTRWFSAGTLSSVGLVIAALGLYLLSRIAPGQAPAANVLPMLLIGLGAGLPWGLMDGLSVSVVPKERAGMATGIFSTTRVAGEGIALALVVALLAGLLQLSMAAALPEHPQLPLAAQQLASGNLQASAALLPELGRELLLGLYAKAFTWLLYALIAITLVAALVVRLMLHEPRRA
ncbi:Sugar phosphate permease [Pseudomonas chlororaphis]|uniref:MFS transporter n=1 Tax=Pseudomonas chlororaphis TaxID=587753 RepID=UPI00087924FE|nr:MFS transporter [Pseudomonas chlororaphis]AZD66768.1 putative MFS-type transporter [Pseudomonas chlororaphis subsp. aurantiaca]AZD73248.1 putative MFS-type transporter [Pseudomonas chlororaphis subsp. aurantiaca]QIT22809.1 MFS transporter [Pseudomonas chlororaphis subsp. aurantiaca]WDH06984.1 MFS transporter [Pseudomonas chlororaphis]WDH10262.1 MFS transporter [Pseudomonas chlororaphis]